MTENLWNIPKGSDLRTPLSIMKEQANYLTESTRKVVRGSVSTGSAGEGIVSELRIVVPSLGHYVYVILSYNQNVLSPYPGEIESNILKKSYNVNNEDEFLKALSDNLSSEEMSRLLANLMSSGGD